MKQRGDDSSGPETDVTDTAPDLESAKVRDWAVWTAFHALQHMESRDLPDGVRLANQADKIAYFLSVLREQGYDVVPLDRENERLRERFVRRWVCGVQRSGYHNGAVCSVRDPHHDGWGCGWKWEASIADENAERFGLSTGGSNGTR